MSREREGGGEEGESDLLAYFSTVAIPIFQFMSICHRSKYSLKTKSERDKVTETGESDSCAYLLRSMGIFHSSKLTHFSIYEWLQNGRFWKRRSDQPTR